MDKENLKRNIESQIQELEKPTKLEKLDLIASKGCKYFLALGGSTYGNIVGDSDITSLSLGISIGVIGYTLGTVIEDIIEEKVTKSRFNRSLNFRNLYQNIEKYERKNE